MPEFAQGSPLWETIVALIILAGSVLVALMVHPALTRVARGLAARSKTTLDDALVAAITRPLFVFVLVHGTFAALTTTTFLDAWQDKVNKAWLATALAVAVWGIQRVANAVIQWYGHEVATRTGSKLDDKLLPLVRRLINAAILVIGALLILDNLGVKLSPLLAGLGIGGLAVALALQPTLSAFFAGAYVIADGGIAVGDFIEVSGGPMGNVSDIGWRTTKIQTPEGNLVIIPNSKLVDSVVTNFQAPTPDMNAVVKCGVSYESDLARVEQVALDVARQVIQDLPDSVVVKDFQPIFLFREFGDSNVDFITILRAKDRGKTFPLTHEFVKRLHARFAAEGIEINYPVRKLVYAADSNGQGQKATVGGANSNGE